MAEYDPMAGFRLPNPLEGVSPSSGFGSNNSSNYMNFGFSNPALNPDVTAGVVSPDTFDWRSFMFGGHDSSGMKTNGALGAGLGIAQGLGSAYMGMRQYGLAKDQLAFQKSAYNKNYAAQRQSTNTGLQDRQAARVASNSGAYESVGSYMDKNRIA